MQTFRGEELAHEFDLSNSLVFLVDLRVRIKKQTAGRTTNPNTRDRLVDAASWLSIAEAEANVRSRRHWCGIAGVAPVIVGTHTLTQTADMFGVENSGRRGHAQEYAPVLLALDEKATLKQILATENRSFVLVADGSHGGATTPRAAGALGARCHFSGRSLGGQADEGPSAGCTMPCSCCR